MIFPLPINLPLASKSKSSPTFLSNSTTAPSESCSTSLMSMFVLPSSTVRDIVTSIKRFKLDEEAPDIGLEPPPPLEGGGGGVNP